MLRERDVLIESLNYISVGKIALEVGSLIQYNFCFKIDSMIYLNLHSKMYRGLQAGSNTIIKQLKYYIL